MTQNWPHLDDVSHSKSEVRDEEDIARLMACRCINARGAIAHGKPPGLMYEPKDISQYTVSEIFDSYGEGSKFLARIGDIKKELLQHGPVVSTSFRLSNSIANSPMMANSFLMKQVSKTHPILTTGWKVT